MSVINSYSSANKIKKRFTAKEINNKNQQKSKMMFIFSSADFEQTLSVVLIYCLLADDNRSATMKQLPPTKMKSVAALSCFAACRASSTVG